MASYKTKKTMKQILAVALAGLAAFGAIFGLVKLSEKLKEETKVIHPTFSVGGLNAAGEYEETDGSIYTKESFECQGLSVKLDFDSNVTYQAFYYDKLGEYVSSTPVYDEGKELEVPNNVTHARLEVTPIWAEDVDEEDRVVHWYNVASYANQLEITVNKEQTGPVDSVQLFETINDLDETIFSDTTAFSNVALEFAGFMYNDMTLFAGKKITRIGLPVSRLVNGFDKDNFFTISVVDGDYQTATVITSERLYIYANTYSVDEIDQYVYFDVDIDVGTGETLVFGTTADSILPVYSKNTLAGCGTFYWKVFSEDAVAFPSGSLLFDVYVADEE